MEHRPAAPESVKLQLRQQAGFGCCKCGRPVYEYHHIVEYSDDPHFRPEDMMVLCPWCHDEATKGAMTQNEQRNLKAHPYNVERGLAGGFLKINHDACILETGSIRFIADGDVVRVDGEALLSLGMGPSSNLELSLALYDREDHLLVRIDKNEWISEQDSFPWDIESGFQYLRVRQKKGDIRFEINTSHDPIEIRVNLWRKGYLIEMGPEMLSFGKLKPAIVFKYFTFDRLCFEINTVTEKLTFGSHSQLARRESC